MTWNPCKTTTTEWRSFILTSHFFRLFFFFYSSLRSLLFVISVNQHFLLNWCSKSFTVFLFYVFLCTTEVIDSCLCTFKRNTGGKINGMNIIKVKTGGWVSNWQLTPVRWQRRHHRRRQQGECRDELRYCIVWHFYNQDFEVADVEQDRHRDDGGGGDGRGSGPKHNMWHPFSMSHPCVVKSRTSSR